MKNTATSAQPVSVLSAPKTLRLLAMSLITLLLSYGLFLFQLISITEVWWLSVILFVGCAWHCRLSQAFSATVTDLNTQTSNTFRVLLQNNVQYVSQEHLHVDDILLLQTGDIIPFNGVLLSGDVRIENTRLKLPRREISSKDDENTRKLLGGEAVVHGSGRMKLLSTTLSECSESFSEDADTGTSSDYLAALYMVSALVVFVALGLLYKETAFNLEEIRQTCTSLQACKILLMSSVFGCYFAILLQWTTFHDSSALFQNLLRVQLSTEKIAIDTAQSASQLGETKYFFFDTSFISHDEEIRIGAFFVLENNTLLQRSIPQLADTLQQSIRLQCLTNTSCIAEANTETLRGTTRLDEALAMFGIRNTTGVSVSTHTHTSHLTPELQAVKDSDGIVYLRGSLRQVLEKTEMFRDSQNQRHTLTEALKLSVLAKEELGEDVTVSWQCFAQSATCHESIHDAIQNGTFDFITAFEIYTPLKSDATESIHRLRESGLIPVYITSSPDSAATRMTSVLHQDSSQADSNYTAAELSACSTSQLSSLLYNLRSISDASEVQLQALLERITHLSGRPSITTKTSLELPAASKCLVVSTSSTSQREQQLSKMTFQPTSSKSVCDVLQMCQKLSLQSKLYTSLKVAILVFSSLGLVYSALTDLSPLLSVLLPGAVLSYFQLSICRHSDTSYVQRLLQLFPSSALLGGALGVLVFSAIFISALPNTWNGAVFYTSFGIFGLSLLSYSAFKTTKWLSAKVLFWICSTLSLVLIASLMTTIDPLSAIKDYLTFSIGVLVLCSLCRITLSKTLLQWIQN